MSDRGTRPELPDDFEESPDWTEEDFARARRGAPWLWHAAERLRSTAAELRHQADLLEQQADALDDPAYREAG